MTISGCSCSKDGDDLVNVTDIADVLADSAFQSQQIEKWRIRCRRKGKTNDVGVEFSKPRA